ncbi:MAG: ACP S-malonyltransferase [Phycisphaerales bacterium]|nr:ACP S-malonyltransferase [Phycisphaerales bacterium]
MAKATYILCPGQGAQHPGMGKDFYEKFPAARAVFDRADAILQRKLSELCFHGPEERLNQTDISQPAIYVTSVACFAAATEAGLISPGQVTAYAGLSLGEYTALHLAGALDFEQGLRLVAARGRFMQEAAEASPGGMVAVLGADSQAVETLCAKASGGEVLVPANFNAPGQIVVSGTRGACERFGEAAQSAGFKAVPLAVAGAFHSPLMASAAERMRQLLAAATLAMPRTTVYSNVTARPHVDPPGIAAALVDQIVKPVLWEQTMQVLAADPEARWVELAPGRVLTGLLKKVNRRVAVETYATADALKGTG